MEGAPKNKNIEETERKAFNRRLSTKRINELLEEYGPRGLQEDPSHSEYFLITRADGAEIHFHKWKTIPISRDGGKTVSDDRSIHEYIERLLQEKENEVGE